MLLPYVVNKNKCTRLIRVTWGNGTNNYDQKMLESAGKIAQRPKLIIV